MMKVMYEEKYDFKHVVWLISFPATEEQFKWTEYHLIIDPLPAGASKNSIWEDKYNGIGLWESTEDDKYGSPDVFLKWYNENYDVPVEKCGLDEIW